MVPVEGQEGTVWRKSGTADCACPPDAGDSIVAMIKTLGLAVVFCVMFTPRDSHAQHDTTATLTGTVKDSTGRPLSGVEVYVLTAGRGAHTDDNGRYTVVHLLNGPTRLRARTPGWQPVDTAITLGANANTTMNFVLKRRIDALDTIRVVSQDSCEPRGFKGFECRRKAGIGAFRDSAELAALKPIYYADLFDGIRGVKRVPIRLDMSVESTTGWRCILLLVNGRRPFAGETREFIMHTAVGFEFYDDEDKIPEWYRVLNFRHCSVAVFWLKGAPQTFEKPPAAPKKPD
jgi:hypothetical protein